MVMAEALAVGEACLPAYSHLFSPHKFTQPQLFACLVLKEFEKKDYRGVCQLLHDCSDLRDVIGLRIVPHFTTLQKAAARLLKIAPVRRLLEKTIRDVHRRRTLVAYAAGDSSGFDARHASRYFVWRRDKQQEQQEQKDRKSTGNRPKKRRSYQRYGKLMLIVCCRSHAILAAVASEGPTPDIDQLDGVVAELPASLSVRHMVLDAGFDSAHNHRLLRERLGIRSTIPPEHGRPPKDPATLPRDRYRRLMRTRFNSKAYRHRPQVETVFSMLKRNFGSELRARTVRGRRRDLRLRVLTHNIALALFGLFYRALPTPFSRPDPFSRPAVAARNDYGQARVESASDINP
jgi:hypothetical protein